MEILDTDSIVEKEQNKIDGKRRPPKELQEELVDEEYKRSSITPKCKEFFNDVKQHFGEKDQLVAFKEIAEYSETRGTPYPIAVGWMRMLWKAGYVRRFFEGYFIKAHIEKTSTGEKYGIHYLW